MKKVKKGNAKQKTLKLLCRKIGRKNGKLTEQQVKSIRKKCKAGESQVAVAKKYKVGPWIISGIITKKTYLWVK